MCIAGQINGFVTVLILDLVYYCYLIATWWSYSYGASDVQFEGWHEGFSHMAACNYNLNVTT